MKNIIVPTDFSACANNALQYAIVLAKYLDAKIHVIYVFGSTVMWQSLTPEGTPISSPMPIPDTDYKKMDEIEKELQNHSNLKYECYIKAGFLEEKLIELSENINAGLLVMGTKGANDQLEAWVGTNTARMVESKKITVISVPESYNGKLEKNSDLVLAIDFEPINDWSVMDSFNKLAQSLQSKINVFYVKDHTEDAEKIAYEKAIFAELVVFFSPLDITMNHATKGDIVTSIDRFAKQKKAALVMMVSHHRGWFEDIFHKSVTSDMTLHGKVPLMTIPDNQLYELNKSYEVKYW